MLMKYNFWESTLYVFLGNDFTLIVDVLENPKTDKALEHEE